MRKAAPRWAGGGRRGPATEQTGYESRKRHPPKRFRDGEAGEWESGLPEAPGRLHRRKPPARAMIQQKAGIERVVSVPEPRFHLKGAFSFLRASAEPVPSCLWKLSRGIKSQRGQRPPEGWLQRKANPDSEICLPETLTDPLTARVVVMSCNQTAPSPPPTLRVPQSDWPVHFLQNEPEGPQFREDFVRPYPLSIPSPRAPVPV